MNRNLNKVIDNTQGCRLNKEDLVFALGIPTNYSKISETMTTIGTDSR
jgi:hypothetical protein